MVLDTVIEIGGGVKNIRFLLLTRHERVDITKPMHCLDIIQQYEHDVVYLLLYKQVDKTLMSVCC